MRRRRDEIELQQFYERWASHVLLFCRLYCGDTETAETVVAQTFLKYFRSELPLHLDRLPTALMSLAIEECTDYDAGGGTEVASDFERGVLALQPDERAVFILHGALELQLPWVAAITQLPFAAMSQLWVRALLQLRISMVKDTCSRLSEEYGTPPSASAGACA